MCDAPGELTPPAQIRGRRVGLRSRFGANLIREECLEALTGVGVDHLLDSLRMDVLQP
jgi:hypothetical protein